MFLYQKRSNPWVSQSFDLESRRGLREKEKGIDRRFLCIKASRLKYNKYRWSYIPSRAKRRFGNRLLLTYIVSIDINIDRRPNLKSGKVLETGSVLLGRSIDIDDRYGSSIVKPNIRESLFNVKEDFSLLLLLTSFRTKFCLFCIKSNNKTIIIRIKEGKRYERGKF